MPEFPCTGPVSAHITMAAGTCDVTAEQRDSFRVDVEPLNPNDSGAREAADATEISYDNQRLTVRVPEPGIGWLLKRHPALRITVRVPAFSDLNVKAASADVTVLGETGRVGVTTASGGIDVAHAADVNANTASGDVKVIVSSGQVHANTASGDIDVEHADGDVISRSASGDVRIGYAGGNVAATTASGDVLVRHGARGLYKIRTVSGEVSIGVAKGVGVWLDLSSTSGRTSSDLSVGDMPTAGGEPDMNLQVRTISGDIEVLRTRD